MIANPIFQKRPKRFWSEVKLISMSLGYSDKDLVKAYSIEQITQYLTSEDLDTSHLVDKNGMVTNEGDLLVKYFKFRADILNTVVSKDLMNRDEAKHQFEILTTDFIPKVKLPFNKQKKDKRHYAYLTCIVNVLTEMALGNIEFDSDPRKLATVTKNNKLLQILSRRLDGAYPSIKNPYAIWEIKEYYGTTTFGSRVADGVYETMLDGYEIENLREHENIDIKHYLVVDDFFTWWKCGKSYLCRLVDLLNEGKLDEVIFGKEILSRWPKIVSSWPNVKLPSQQ